MRYFVLGPLELREGGRTVALPHGRQRLVLALLVLNANQTLSTDRLVDALWGEAPPPSATRSLHNLVSALRKQLPEGALVTRGHGYALEAGSLEIDLQLFDTLVAEGRAALEAGDPGRAAALLGDALALWRGPPLDELAYEPAVREDAERLEEQRLTTLEDRIDADLTLGRHAQVLPELNVLTAEHPLRERMVAARVLALYRSGRQADALTVCRDHRARQTAEFGLEPGPALRRLELAVLSQDPELEAVDALPRRAASPLARRPWTLAAAGRR
jgi:DNA-binding SARP family transcriptional activator